MSLRSSKANNCAGSGGSGAMKSRMSIARLTGLIYVERS